MRRIERSSRFKKDFKREAKGVYKKFLTEMLEEVLNHLINDRPLEGSYRDHSLTGQWSGYRECHVKPDFLLIYRKVEPDLLQLVRLGSHSELF